MNTNNINVSQNSAYKRIKRNLTKVLLIAILSFLTFSPALAQYKLELEWMKELVNIAQPGISAITKSNNDSLIYVASPNRILTINTTNGETLKIDTVESTYFNFLLSRDGNTLAAAGDWGGGLLNPQTFKRIYWDSIPYGDYRSDFRTLTFNELQKKIVLCSKSYVGSRETFIRIYDLSTKSLIKEFSPSYFGDVAIKNASITDDGKYVIYGYETYTSNPNKTHYFVKIMDLEGKLIKDLGETSSSKFTTTIDGKTLIYFDNSAMHFFDLETLKDKSSISKYGGMQPEKMEMSKDSKFMLLGAGLALIYIDLETYNSFFLNENSTWDKYLLSQDNSNVYLAGSQLFLKFNLKLDNSISKDEKLSDYRIQSMDNNLIITNSNSIDPNLQFTILTLDGKIIKILLPNEIQFNPNRAIIDISKLNSGTYFLQIIDGNSVISSLKFLKVN